MVSKSEEEKKLSKSYFDVLGLCCTSEVKLVERILKNLDGVKDVQVALPTKTVIVLHDTDLVSDFQIVKALNQAKLEASIRIKGAKAYKKKWPNPYAIGCGVLLCLSFLKYLYHPFQWLALGAVAIGIVPIAFRAFMAIWNFTFGDINILVVIAVAGSIALQDYWEAGTIVFLFTVAEWLESRASHKANAAMSSLANLVPQRAVLAETGVEVKVDEVIVNTLLAVKEGEVIPIDGIVTEGSCEIDEKTLTGESFPVSKQKDSNVWAGTININGYVVIKTMTVAEDCVVAKMTKLVEEAQNNKSKTERYIETCAKYYTPAIIAISLGIAVVPVALRLHNLRRWYHLALVVLVSACPCALVLSTPVAMFCALIRAATFGVFFKGGQYVEALAKVNTIAFDKTGTITRGEFEVTEFKSLLDDIDLSTLLYWVSSIERKSSHPLASAVVDYAESHSVEPNPQQVEGFQNFVGEGVYGEIDGKHIYIGNQKIANRAECKSVPELEGNIVEGKSIGYVFLGSRPAGIFCLSDVCRTGAKEALKELKSMGIKTAMLTGDCQSAAKHVQDQLGGCLEVVQYELLPADKARIIKEFQQKDFTAMTGDGINDAPAMATADVGISMGISGSALAVETGDIILMTNDIQRIPEAIRLARSVKWKIIENIFLSIVTKGAIIGLAIAGHPLVWAAVLADVGTCLLVILNSMLLLRGMPNHGKKSKTKCCKSSACSEGNDHKSHSTKTPHHHHHQKKTCCNGDKIQNGCDSQASSSNLSCCPDETIKGTSECNGHHPIHKTISLNHGCCNSLNETTRNYDGGKHECSDHGSHKTESETIPHQVYDEEAQTNHACLSHTKHNGKHECSHHGSHKTESETIPHQVCDEEAQTNHACSSHTKHNGKHECSDHGSHMTESETIPHQVCGEQAQTNHACSSHTKHNANSRCKIHASNTNDNKIRSDHHHHGGCGDVKSSCCDDLRKKCCVQNGHLLENNIRGGLSEIVIE